MKKYFENRRKLVQFLRYVVFKKISDRFLSVRNIHYYRLFASDWKREQTMPMFLEKPSKKLHLDYYKVIQEDNRYAENWR